MSHDPSNRQLLALRSPPSPRRAAEALASRADNPANPWISGVRRITTETAARYLGHSVRTLEDWRQSWPQEGEVDGPGQCKGPKLVKVGKRVLYDVRELANFHAARKAQGLNRA